MEKQKARVSHKRRLLSSPPVLSQMPMTHGETKARHSGRKNERTARPLATVPNENRIFPTQHAADPTGTYLLRVTSSSFCLPLPMMESLVRGSTRPRERREPWYGRISNAFTFFPNEWRRIVREERVQRRREKEQRSHHGKEQNGNPRARSQRFPRGTEVRWRCQNFNSGVNDQGLG